MNGLTIDACLALFFLLSAMRIGTRTTTSTTIGMPLPARHADSLHMHVHNVYLSNLLMNSFGDKHEYTQAQYDRDVRDAGLRYEDEEIVAYMLLTRLYHVMQLTAATHKATGDPRMVMRTALYLSQVVSSERPFPPRSVTPQLFAKFKLEYLRAIDYRVHVTAEQFARTRQFLQAHQPPSRLTSVAAQRS